MSKEFRNYRVLKEINGIPAGSKISFPFKEDHHNALGTCSSCHVGSKSNYWMLGYTQMAKCMPGYFEEIIKKPKPDHTKAIKACDESADNSKEAVEQAKRLNKEHSMEDY